MDFYKFVKPLGIITYSLMVLAIVSGLFRWKLKYHKWLAITALLAATIHALIVILD